MALTHHHHKARGYQAINPLTRLGTELPIMTKVDERKIRPLPGRPKVTAANGRCLKCGATDQDLGNGLCRRCWDRAKKKMLHYYRRRSEGLCPNCGKVPPDGRVWCPECIAARTIWNTLRREK